MLCLSLPITKAYVELTGVEKARAYLQCIYCKVNQQIQRDLSHTIKSSVHVCECMVDIYMVANLILLCSLKTYLFELIYQLCSQTQCKRPGSFLISGDLDGLGMMLVLTSITSTWVGLSLK